MARCVSRLNKDAVVEVPSPVSAFSEDPEHDKPGSAESSVYPPGGVQSDGHSVLSCVLVFQLHTIPQSKNANPTWCPRHPSTTWLFFLLHDTPLVVPTTPLHDMVVFAFHDTPLVVSTTPLHDMNVFSLHDMITVPHDTLPRHALHDTLHPRHG